MIVTVRGTSGSGKSTLVRKIMGLYSAKRPVVWGPRKKTIAYLLHSQGAPSRRLAVLGGYENACGGCDGLSLPGMRDMVDEMVRACHANGYDVLFEGLILGGERHRMIQMAKDGLPLQVILLTTPEGVCLDRVAGRRRAAGNEAPLDPTNTVNKAEEVRRACRDCAAGGVRVIEQDGDTAFCWVRGEFGV